MNEIYRDHFQNRNGYGFEIKKDFYDKSIKWINKVKAEYKMFSYKKISKKVNNELFAGAELENR